MLKLENIHFNLKVFIKPWSCDFKTQLKSQCAFCKTIKELVQYLSTKSQYGTSDWTSGPYLNL